MADRSYLSIGDVLALLRDEFPDITISKIRFLESRGLLDPERTPSGYRKFCSPDVERLRWILRQQRENFLPLKVIKGRLEGAGAGEPAADEPARPRATTRLPLGAGDGAEPLVAVVHELVGAAANGPAERPPPATGADGLARAVRPRSAGDPAARWRGGSRPERTPEIAPLPSDGGTEPAGDGPAHEATADAGRRIDRRGDGSAGAEDEDTAAGAGAASREPRTGAGGRGEQAPTQTPVLSGVSLTAGELAEAAGLLERGDRRRSSTTASSRAARSPA